MIPHSSAGQPDGYGRRYAGVDGPADHRQAGGRAAAGAGAVGAVTGAARASAGAHPAQESALRAAQELAPAPPAGIAYWR